MKKIIILLGAIALIGCGCNKPQERTAETSALLKNLGNIDGVMYGHQDDILYGVDWWDKDDMSDVKSVVGDYPGVIGFEIGGIELADAESLDKVRFDNIRKGIVRAYEMGCVVTISWHLDNPLTGGDSWDVSSTEVVGSILAGGAKHEEYNLYLERLAAFLSSFKIEDGTAVPVLFRPYHEHTGSWFWWGKNLCTAEEYIALWRYTYEYVSARTDGNILWVYSTDRIKTAEEYLERYPGDDIIDILGFDCYQFGENSDAEYIATVRNILEIVTSEGRERGKPVVFSETGYQRIPNPEWWTQTLMKAIEGYDIGYVLTWRNAYDPERIYEHGYFAPYPGQVSADDFKRFFDSDKILFRRDLPNMYK